MQCRTDDKTDLRFHAYEGYISSLFIAEYSDRILLLDCGSKADHNTFVDIIENRLGRKMSDVALLVVTHLHPDHAGSVKSLSRAYSIPVAAPQGINLWYRGICGKMQHFVDCQLAHIAVRKKGGDFRSVRYPYKIDADYFLADNDTLPLFDDWTALSVPGHTSHDMVLYNECCGILYSSDCIISINGKYLAPYPVTSFNNMRQSLGRIGSLNVRKLALAHGGLVETECIKEISDEVAARLDEPLTGLLALLSPLTRLSPEAGRRECG